MSWQSLLPQPLEISPAHGSLEIDATTTVGGEPGAARWFRRHIGSATGLPLAESPSPTITFGLSDDVDGHRIEITPDGVLVTASNPAHTHHAAQTLRQLLPPDAHRNAPIHSGTLTLPCGTLTDRPRFGWRGCHLDVARHFLPKREVLRFIELLAMHKLNALHLHLTDDQGWRIDVPGLPELARVASWRSRSTIGRGENPTFDNRPHGGYYTTEDLREIVSYAAEHHIAVIPEISLPGHSQAAIAAYPELGTGKPVPVRDSWDVSDNALAPRRATIDFYRIVLDHVMTVFPSPVICLGGDAVPGATQAHGALLRRLVEHVHAHGRHTSVRDESIDMTALPTDTIVLAWRGTRHARQAAEIGHDVLLCPETHFHFDHRQSDHPAEPVPVGHLSTLSHTYSYQPPLEDALGLQAHVWSHHLDSPRRVDYAVFPRLCAFAEVAWSRDRDLPDFAERLTQHHLPRLDAAGVEYRPLNGPRPWQTQPGVPGQPR